MTQPVPLPTQLPGPSSIPYEAIRDLFQDLANLRTVWADAPRPELGISGGPLAYLLLTPTAYVPIGIDDYRTQYDPTTDTVLTSTGGQRRLTVQCRVSSLDFLRDPPADALERLRWGLRRPAAHAVLMANGLAFVRFPGAILTYSSVISTKDKRIMIHASMDVQLARAAVANDDLETYIAEVNGGQIVPIDLGFPIIPTPPPTPGGQTIMTVAFVSYSNTPVQVKLTDVLIEFDASGWTSGLGALVATLPQAPPVGTRCRARWWKWVAGAPPPVVNAAAGDLLTPYSQGTETSGATAASTAITDTSGEIEWVYDGAIWQG